MARKFGTIGCANLEYGVGWGGVCGNLIRISWLGRGLIETRFTIFLGIEKRDVFEILYFVAVIESSRKLKQS